MQIHAVLQEWSTARPCRLDFTGDLFAGVYDDHMTTLRDLATSPTTRDQFHLLMAKIYEDAL